METDDYADRHVARWRNHWVDVAFDPEVEAIVVRMGRLRRHLREASLKALAEVGLQDFEYETLHQLMVRESPGRATPTALAEELGISGAGMTGRLDGLERSGWIHRTPAVDDRRRVDVEITKAGMEIWKAAIRLRADAEERLFTTLPPKERSRLAALLKKLALSIES